MTTRGMCPNCGEFETLRGSGICAKCEIEETKQDAEPIETSS